MLRCVNSLYTDVCECIQASSFFHSNFFHYDVTGASLSEIDGVSNICNVNCGVYIRRFLTYFQLFVVAQGLEHWSCKPGVADSISGRAINCFEFTRR